MKNVKTGGRIAGTPNKVNADLKVLISDFLSNNWDTLQNDFDKLEPKERIYFLEKLLQYNVPKMQAQSVDLKENKMPQIIFQHASGKIIE